MSGYFSRDRACHQSWSRGRWSCFSLLLAVVSTTRATFRLFTLWWLLQLIEYNPSAIFRSHCHEMMIQILTKATNQSSQLISLKHLVIQTESLLFGCTDEKVSTFMWGRYTYSLWCSLYTFMAAWCFDIDDLLLLSALCASQWVRHVLHF